jgi:hypothetical protein
MQVFFIHSSGRKVILLLLTIAQWNISAVFAQAENEIQVYASPTIQHKWTIFELHSNYTVRGAKGSNPNQYRWTNETLEITTGIAKNVELGFYTFTSFSPSGQYQYLGSQVRPRVTVPQQWKWPFGTSLSVEFGFFRDNIQIPFYWQGEIRPIIDKTINNWYLSFNPNIDFVLTGANKQWGFSPQAKTVYTIQKKYGIGIEYYTGLGTFQQLLPFRQQEHLLGPMFDLYTNPNWELNGGFLFGLTPNSNQTIFKLLLGQRVGKKKKE